MSGLLTRAQLEHLRRLLDDGALRSSNRTGKTTISSAAARALRDRGLVDLFDLNGHTMYAINDAGRAALGANITHVPPRINETAAYQRGRAAAGDARRLGIVNLTQVINASTEGTAAHAFAGHQLARLTSIETTEATE